MVGTGQFVDDPEAGILLRVTGYLWEANLAYNPVRRLCCSVWTFVQRALQADLPRTTPVTQDVQTA